MIKAGFVTYMVAIQVTRDNIRHYCNVIGENNPIFHNLEAAQNAGYADLVLPPTYPVLFWQTIDIPWLEKQSPLIQSEQQFEYAQALVANKTYMCQIKVLKVRQIGKKQFSKHELSIHQDDETIATSSTTLMLVLE